ncbi:MAG: hypothetical protein AAGG50_20500 [Bacteroidota bacterium]
METPSLNATSPSAVGLALVRQCQGNAPLLGLWHALVWELYLEAGAPLGRTEAACRQWWDETMLPDAE